MMPPLDSDEIDQQLEVLETSHEPEQLVAAADALAVSANSSALLVLGRFLVSEAFLARLDVLDDPQLKLTNLRHVLGVLEANPAEATGRLCELLAAHPGFLADPDRVLFLLPTLAAVRPMTAGAEAVFRATNADGFFNANGPLLVANGSPRALALFEEMIADASAAADDRVDMIHRAVLSHRLQATVLAACVRLLGRGLEPEVEAGLVETLFDYHEREWFGVARFAPTPPPWSAAETAVLQSYLQLGHELAQGGRLSPENAAAVGRTLQEIRDLLATRWG